MNAKNAAPLIVTLPAIAAAAPPLLIGGAIVCGIFFGLKWLLSEDKKPEMPETAPVIAAPPRPALVIPSVSGGNSGQNRSIPANSGGNPSVTPAPSVSASAIVPASSAPAMPKIPVPPPTIPAVKIAPEIPSLPPIKKKFVTREDLATAFHHGARGLTRTAAVTALKNLGFGKTAAYKALQSDGRFNSWLQFAPDGIITWKD
jgi:hypothetical protein